MRLMSEKLLVWAQGGSMIPSILPNSQLRVERICPEQFCVGDVVCYIDERLKGTAHRLIRVSVNGSRRRFYVRGDTHWLEEEVPVESLLYRVVAVSHPMLSYNMNGYAGNVFRRLALSKHHRARMLKFIALRSWNIAVWVKRHLGQR